MVKKHVTIEEIKAIITPGGAIQDTVITICQKINEVIDYINKHEDEKHKKQLSTD